MIGGEIYEYALPDMAMNNIELYHIGHIVDMQHPYDNSNKYHVMANHPTI
jgi:hypothetical protein